MTSLLISWPCAQAKDVHLFCLQSVSIQRSGVDTWREGLVKLAQWFRTALNTASDHDHGAGQGWLWNGYVIANWLIWQMSKIDHRLKKVCDMVYLCRIKSRNLSMIMQRWMKWYRYCIFTPFYFGRWSWLHEIHVLKKLKKSLSFSSLSSGEFYGSHSGDYIK